MREQTDYLTAALLGAKVLEQVATRQSCKVTAIRTLGMAARLSENNHKATTPAVAQWLDCSYYTALIGVNECVARGWMERQQTQGWGLRLTLEGLRVVDLLKRAEREARNLVKSAELAKWPRAYRRKAIA